jgi:hypothetical protein
MNLARYHFRSAAAWSSKGESDTRRSLFGSFLSRKESKPRVSMPVLPATGQDRRLRRHIVTILVAKGAFLGLLWLFFFSGGKDASPQAVVDRLLPSVSISTKGE